MVPPANCSTATRPSTSLAGSCPSPARPSQCPPCAEVYRAYTYQLIRAGLGGGTGTISDSSGETCISDSLALPGAADQWAGIDGCPLGQLAERVKIQQSCKVDRRDAVRRLLAFEEMMGAH